MRRTIFNLILFLSVFSLFIIFVASNNQGGNKLSTGSTLHVYGPPDCTGHICGPVNITFSTGPSGHHVEDNLPAGDYCVDVVCSGGGCGNIHLDGISVYSITPTGGCTCSNCSGQ